MAHANHTKVNIESAANLASTLRGLSIKHGCSEELEKFLKVLKSVASSFDSVTALHELEVQNIDTPQALIFFLQKLRGKLQRQAADATISQVEHAGSAPLGSVFRNEGSRFRDADFLMRGIGGKIKMARRGLKKFFSGK